MKVIDNISTRLKDELMQSIQKGSKVTIAASCFSMYAYKELKKQLDTIDELRFLFTSPTFVKESARKERREFYIPRLDRESGLYGTEFEIKLRNEMTQNHCFCGDGKADLDGKASHYLHTVCGTAQ